MSVIAHWSGQGLYSEWCDAPGSDREAYWRDMNPADKAHWKRLAEVVAAYHERRRAGAIGAIESLALAKELLARGDADAAREHVDAALEQLGEQ